MRICSDEDKFESCAMVVTYLFAFRMGSICKEIM